MPGLGEGSPSSSKAASSGKVVCLPQKDASVARLARAGKSKLFVALARHYPTYLCRIELISV